jgi:tetratricopeptide (TPR) repeat protein
LSSRVLTALRALVVLVVIAILVAGVALVQAIVVGDDGTPRTATERAIQSAEEAVRANPDDPVARVRLAAAYLEQGSNAKAIEQAELALRINPEMPDAHFVLGVAHYRNGDIDEAIASLTTAGETEGQFAPFYQEVFVALARAHEANDDLDSAIEAFTTAFGYGPENATVYVQRGEVLERAEQWYEAAVDYAYALIFIADYPEALEGLARIEQDHPDDYARAMETIEQIRAQLNPHGEDAGTTE